MGKAQELSKVGMGTPLGNFGPILEFGVPDVGWTAKDLGTMEVFASQASATKKFHWGQSNVATWCVFVEPHCIGHGKWP